jgi:hypothetical protein
LTGARRNDGPQTIKGEQMKVEQISIFIENKSGRLAEVSKTLGEAGVNIRALSLADTSDFGILRLIVDKTDTAKAALKERGFTVSKTEVVAVEVPDRPMGLFGILQILDHNGVNVEYMYAFVERCGENAVIIFRFDDPEAAIRVLVQSGVTVLEGEKVSLM